MVLKTISPGCGGTGISDAILYVICIVNVKSISSYFSLQNNKCVCDIEILKTIIILK